jgi:putative spermidine/putrescine transport system permease protein
MLRLTRGAKIGFGAVVALVLLFMYLPLFLVIINSFNVAAIANWPISGFTFDWWVRAFNNDALWAAVRNSVIVATGATVIALLLGTMSAWSRVWLSATRSTTCWSRSAFRSDTSA